MRSGRRHRQVAWCASGSRHRRHCSTASFPKPLPEAPWRSGEPRCVILRYSGRGAHAAVRPLCTRVWGVGRSCGAGGRQREGAWCLHVGIHMRAWLSSTPSAVATDTCPRAQPKAGTADRHRAALVRQGHQPHRRWQDAWPWLRQPLDVAWHALRGRGTAREPTLRRQQPGGYRFVRALRADVPHQEAAGVAQLGLASCGKPAPPSLQFIFRCLHT